MSRVNGRMTRKTIGRYPQTGLHDARICGAEELTKMARGELEPAHRSKYFRDVFEEWLDRDQRGNRSMEQVRRSMELHVLPHLGDAKLDAITKRQLINVVDKVVDLGAPVHANRLLAYLRRFFNWCGERDYLDRNPTTGVAKPAKEHGRDRVLSPDELGRVMRAADAMGYPFGPFIKLLALTGQRRDEIAGVRWSEIDETEGVWVLPASRSKNGKAHTVHLSTEAMAVLYDVPRLADVDLVFPATRAKRHGVEGSDGIVRRPISGFSKAKIRLDKSSGVTGWTFHDLRRSFATHCTEKLGLSPVVIDKVLNHQSGAVRGVAAVYQRGQYLDERRKAMDDWAKWLEEATHG